MGGDTHHTGMWMKIKLGWQGEDEALLQSQEGTPAPTE